VQRYAAARRGRRLARGWRSSVRYLHGRSFTWQGLRGTPAVLAAVAAVVAAQLAFTYLPMMQRIFDTRALGPVEGLVVVLVGPVLMLVLEIEKWLLQKLDWFEELGPTQAA